jgi:hypothetical protein
LIGIALAAALALSPGRYASADGRIEARVEHTAHRKLRVELVGGGVADGGGTAGDCAVVVEGRERAGPVTLAAVAFTSLSQEVTLADLRRAPVAVNVRPTRDGAVVSVSGSLPCGVGSSLDGRLYRRSRLPGKTLIRE